MALAATRWRMTRLVLRQVAWMVIPGIAVGAGAALLRHEWRLLPVCAAIVIHPPIRRSGDSS